MLAICCGRLHFHPHKIKKMKRSSPILFKKVYRTHKVIDGFSKAYYQHQLNYLASDLLDKGFQPTDILEALSRAMKVCRNADLVVERHFMPLYSDKNGVTIRDCKLSLTGYRLVMLNANPDHPVAARFQIKILEQIGKAKKEDYDRYSKKY